MWGILPDNANPIGKDVLQIKNTTINNTGIYQCVGMVAETNKYFYTTSSVRVLGKLMTNITCKQINVHHYYNMVMKFKLYKLHYKY